MGKTCTHCSDTEEKDTLAMATLKFALKSTKTTALVIAIAWLITCALFAGYVIYDKYVDSLYDVVDYSYDLSTDGGGDANFIGNDGDINGQSKS